MKKVILFLAIFGVLAVLTPLITNLTGNHVIDHNITCDGVVMTYYYSPQCSHCRNMEPLISDLISNGCNITKINVQEYPELAINNGVNAIPTLIKGDRRITGEFTIEQVKDLIEN